MCVCVCLKRLEQELNEKAAAHESTYKELVLLSKAHKAALDEKAAMASAVAAARDELTSLESHHDTIQARLQEKKDVVEQLERKVQLSGTCVDLFTLTVLSVMRCVATDRSLGGRDVRSAERTRRRA